MAITDVIYLHFSKISTQHYAPLKKGHIGITDIFVGSVGVLF